ncbi:glycoside hydrolase family 31 protein [Paenibacillus sp. BR2-3]|uniref:glycoside hydrolase family 31 protein n=1 Tax=Paenibacillus sp. BR2-3 TaxID=3048494 RepID=UPI00397798CA
MTKILENTQLIRDQAFNCYAELRMKNSAQTVSFLREMDIILRGQDAPGLLDLSYWLWILGEYTNVTEDMSLITTLKEGAARALLEISLHWKEPQLHWLEVPGKEPAVYLSNLAIMYGAVLAVQPSWSNQDGADPVTAAGLQLLLKNIRELLFANLLKDGKVVSCLGGREIYGDIILAAVPFGLLGIEDRILIEALFVVERELLFKGVRFSESDLYFGGCERPDLSSLLAWYYTEKGDLAKAKLLVEHTAKLQTSVNALELPVVDCGTVREQLYYDYDLKKNNGTVPASPLASTLYGIAAEALNTAIRGNGSLSDTELVHMQHEPAGTDDPYIYAPHERTPRYPQAGELVFLHMMTVPLRQLTQRVWVEYSVDGGEFRETPMTLEKAADGEEVWQAAIGRFHYSQEVVYRFKVQEAEATAVSESFAFRVRDWKPLGEITGVVSEADRVLLQFAALPEMNTMPTLQLIKGQNHALELQLKWMAERVEGAGAKAEAHYSLPLGGYTLEISQTAGKTSWQITGDLNEAVVQSVQGSGKVPFEVLTDGSPEVYKARINLLLQDGEHMYGMGERYARMEYRGYSLDNHVYNEYRSQGLKTYMPVPFYMSSSGYGCFLDTTMYSQFHFGSRESDVLEIEADLESSQSGLSLFLFLGKPLVLIQQLTNVTAKPVLPPKWSFGPWMSSNNWDSQAEVMKQVELTNQYEIPSTVIVLEQWSDEATFYIFNDAQYEAVEGDEMLSYSDFTYPEWGRWPNPKQMVKDLHDNGLKVLLWQIPIQKYMYGITHEQKDNDEKAMLENHYHIHRSNGDPYRIPYNWFKDCLLIDFTNEAGREWWFRKRQYLLDEVDIDGFKTDGGECILGHDLAFADGTSAAGMHNRYPLDYIGSYYDYVQEHRNGNGLTFSRSGYSGAQKYPMHWAGDERSTYEAFRASIIAGLTSGMSGIPFWGWDLGGFHGDIPTAELFIRSAQMAAFCPVMQYHAETKGEFNQDRTPWNIAARTGKPEVIGLYKQYADIRMNILPYVYAEAMHSSESGEPMMRAMFVEFPEEKACSAMTTQYMFGDSLLIAPITDEGHYSKRVYFPQGSWISLFGGERIEGGRSLAVAADLDQIPVFIRQDRVIALNLDEQLQLGAHVGNRVDGYERLAFMMFPVKELNYVFQDDLGCQISLHGRLEDESMHFTVVSNAVEPSYWIVRGMEEVRSVAIHGTDLKRVDDVLALDEQSYCVRGKDVLITCLPGEQQVRINL